MVGLGVIPVIVFRGRREAVWAAPLGVVLARLATDPLLYNYYWLAGEILALVGIAMLFPAAPRWLKIAMVGGFYLVSFGALVDPLPATIARFALLLGLLIAAWRAPVVDAPRPAAARPTPEPV